MTWQEELRQLDSALAGGELAANEYRKRRDEILAAASSAQTPSPVIGPPAGPRPAGAEEDNAEVTQIVSVDNGGSSGNGVSGGSASSASSGAGETEQVSEADATQIISDPTEHEQTQVVTQQAPADQTQVIAATTDERTTPALPPQVPQQSPWAAHRPDPNAPTGVFPRPPQPMLPPPTVTPMDAQDLFASNKAPRDSGTKPWLVALIALVVLALAGSAVWYFALRDDSASTADPAPKQTSETPKPPKPVDIASITLPGEAAKNSGEMDIVKAGELKVIAPAEAALLADAGVDPMVYSGSADGNFRYLLYSYQSDDVEAAKKLTDAIADVQKNIGLKETEVTGSDPIADGVAVTGVSNSSAAALRGLYSYGDTTIQLCVLQVPTGDAGELNTNFAAALKAVTDAAPPTK
jgi:hypothetical protein